MTDILTRLLDLTAAPATPDALAVMRLSLVDWLAVGIAGRDEPVARLTRDMVLDEGGAGQASLFGGGKAPLRAAALVNGAASHALDYDDTHFAHIGHPSVAVIPAALAVAEKNGASVTEVTEAALRGTEASVRMGLTLGRAHYQVGFHQTGTAGAFGAALAAAILLGLDRDATGQALGLVSTRASGLKSQFGTMGKPLNAGIAASNGVEAALLAARGFVSNPGALDGVNGFLQTHHADGPGDQPEGWLMQGVSHKFHACCHGLHATLEALETVKPVDPSAVKGVAVTTHPRWMTVCNQPEPETGLALKFSYRGVVAASLLGQSTAALSTYTDALCADPALVALRDKVSVTADDSVAETAARVELVLGGQRHMAEFDLDAPMAYDDRAARIRSKATALLGAAQAARVWESVHGDHRSVAHLTAEM
ncbi:MmgE/PrpD family protein [Mesobacterium sp. TK19101]|uniref:MmgE/PrpD family protein n=1 Tax=Mesobacterium hydrothermale TaxID=3111907 RepID=A0ABU6HHP5_9RHOB|nr:MmgE/PrpD family protein [Mesobacterium sp. TK19101]MEC3860978.1 MmgE/PrpD family protein [Mesobacterium sp. TK19101]